MGIEITNIVISHMILDSGAIVEVKRHLFQGDCSGFLVELGMVWGGVSVC